MRGIRILFLVISLQQKLILNYLNWKPTVVIAICEIKPETALQLFFSEKKYNVFGEERM